MEIILYKGFKKDFEKLNKYQQKKVNTALDMFKNNPFDHKLKNHKLNGKMINLRSIYVENDLRIILKEFNNYLIVHIISVGSHNQIYY